MNKFAKVTGFIATFSLLLSVSTFPLPKAVEANWFSGSLKAPITFIEESAAVGYSIQNDNSTTNVKVAVTRRQNSNSIRVEQTVQICQGYGSESVCSVETYPEHYFDNAKFTFNFFQGTASLTIPQDICSGYSCDMRLVPLTQLSWQANSGIQKPDGKTEAGGYIRLWRTANVTGQVDGIPVPASVEGTLSIQHNYNYSSYTLPVPIPLGSTGSF